MKRIDEFVSDLAYAEREREGTRVIKPTVTDDALCHLAFCLDWMRRAAEVLNDITDDRVYRDGDPVYDAAAELLKELEGECIK